VDVADLPGNPQLITDRADLGDGLIALGTVLSRHHTDTYRHCAARRHASHCNSNPHNDGSLPRAGAGRDTRPTRHVSHPSSTHTRTTPRRVTLRSPSATGSPGHEDHPHATEA